MSVNSKPFLKWVGGKRQLLPEILRRTPRDFNRYHEPFVGGGAVFFAMASANGFSEPGTINDFNQELVTCYEAVRDECGSLIIELNAHGDEHSENSSWYDSMRSLEFSPKTPKFARAARTIYLNKTCFNGLYRVNKKGKFNVPRGNYVNPKICDADNLVACSKALEMTDIRCSSFEYIRDEAKHYDFVYLDPPYVPIDMKKSFTAYTPGGFGMVQHQLLKEVCDDLTRKGVHWMLSNSAVPWVMETYKAYQIQTVEANRAVNRDGQKRGKVSEVIITNY